MSDIVFEWISYAQIEQKTHIIPDNSWIGSGIDSGHCLISNEKEFVVTLESSGSDAYLTAVFLCADAESVVVSYKGTAALVNVRDVGNFKAVPITPCIGGKVFSDKFVVVWGFRKLACIMSAGSSHEKEFDFGEIVDVYSDNDTVICILIEYPWGEKKVIKSQLPRLEDI
jgi:hypothetical protein